VEMENAQEIDVFVKYNNLVLNLMVSDAQINLVQTKLQNVIN
jgi:hypothetical protein